MPAAEVLQTGRCYCCNSQGLETKEDRHGFTHLTCNHCQLVRLHPGHLIPSADVYTDAYFNGIMYEQTGGGIGYPESYSNLMTSHRTGQYKRYAKELSGVLRHNGPSRPKVLDVGCGYGIFLRVLRDQMSGVEVYGIEVDPKVCERASINLDGAPVYCVDLKEDTSPVPRNYFDAITLLDVIEHLEDPRIYLMRLAECIKPHGYLLLSTPNIESLNARIFGDSWVLHSPPLHTYYFGPHSLSMILGQTGWAIIRRYTERTIFHNERYGMETWRGKLARLVFQNHLCDMLSNQLLRIGSIMTVIAQKIRDE